MKERCHGTGSQLMGFTLAVIAWFGCVGSMLMKDWNRSIVSLPEKIETFTQLVPANELNQRFLGCNLTCNYTAQSILKDINSSIDFNETFYKILTIRVKPAKLLTIGQRGIWYECTFVPIYLASYVKETEIDLNRRYRFSQSHNMVPRVKYINKTIWAYNVTNHTYRLVHQSKRDIKQTKLLITHKFNLRGSVDTLSESNLVRRCNYIGIHRASCLLLGVRTMYALSMICGCLAIFLGFFAIHSDVKIRYRLRFHPIKKEKKNIISILSAIFCLLSGTFVIICCCWFTLETNNFLTSAYQSHHERSNATFLIGDAVLVACTSGVIFIVAASLLGTNVEAKSKTRAFTKRLLRKFKTKTFNDNIEIHSTIL